LSFRDTKRFGLNERETTLLLHALNGLGIPDKFMPTTQWLSSQIGEAMRESHTDFQETGSDQALGEDNKEIPFQYQDLFEKVQKLDDWESAALWFYARGFFTGRSFAEDQE
jgi:hypothetical protein